LALVGGVGLVCGMADVGKQVLGLMTMGAVALVVFAPLGFALWRATASGRTRLIGRAFWAGLIVALAWLGVAITLRQMVSGPVAGWWLLSGPWAAALGAEWARRKALREAVAAEEAEAANDQV